MDEKLNLTAETAESDELATAAPETDENVSRETETAENVENSEKTEKSALWTAEYVLNEAEMTRFVDCSGVITGKKKTLVQGVLAALLCVVNIISYATGGRKMPLFLAIVCAVLCGMVFVTPWYARRNLLKELKIAAEQGRPTRLSGSETALSFGAGEDLLSYEFDQVAVKRYGDLITLALPDKQMVCVPERAVPADGWEALCAHVIEQD